MAEVNRVWRLRKRPVGLIGDDVLSLERESIPEPAAGEFVFRLNYLSLDPTNRIWMSDMDQYMPPVALGAPMRGVVCGTVTKSANPEFNVGDVVSGLGVWADYQKSVPGMSFWVSRYSAFFHKIRYSSSLAIWIFVFLRFRHHNRTT